MSTFFKKLAVKFSSKKLNFIGVSVDKFSKLCSKFGPVLRGMCLRRYFIVRRIRRKIGLSSISVSNLFQKKGAEFFAKFVAEFFDMVVGKFPKLFVVCSICNLGPQCVTDTRLSSEAFVDVRG